MNSHIFRQHTYLAYVAEIGRREAVLILKGFLGLLATWISAD
jgi:hypothetical protein